MSQSSGIAQLGPYTLVNQLGTNGLLVSWQGFDAQQIPVWVVGFPANQLGDRRAWDAFVAEFSALIGTPASRLAAAMRHGEDGGYFWCAYEWLTGSHLGRRAQDVGLPMAPVALEWAAQTIEALMTLQEHGQAHRYISPASLFINDFEQVKLLHAAWGALLLHVNGGVANPAFMSVLPFIAPEVVSGRACDGASDVYGVGATLYYLLCGLPPYWADDPLSLCDAIQTQPISFAPPAEYVPASIVELLQELLSRDPDDRPANLPALVSRIRSLAIDAFADDATAAPEQDLSPDTQNYSARSAAYEPAMGQQGAYVPPQTASTAVDALPPSAPPEEGTGIRSAIKRSSLATAPPSMAVPASKGSASAIGGIEEGGTSAEDKKRYAIMAIAALVVIGGLGYVGVSFVMSLNKQEKEKPLGLLQLQEEIDKQEAKVRLYYKTKSTLTRTAQYNKKHMDSFGRWARALSDLSQVGALTVEMIDAWSTPLDVRSEYIVSAGADKTWDTDDDIYIDSSTYSFGGYQPKIEIPSTNPMFNQQIQALVEVANRRLEVEMETGNFLGSMDTYMSTAEYPTDDSSNYTPPDKYREPAGTRDALYGGLESDEPQ